MFLLVQLWFQQGFYWSGKVGVCTRRAVFYGLNYIVPTKFQLYWQSRSDSVPILLDSKRSVPIGPNLDACCVQLCVPAIFVIGLSLNGGLFLMDQLWMHAMFLLVN